MPVRSRRKDDWFDKRDSVIASPRSSEPNDNRTDSGGAKPLNDNQHLDERYRNYLRQRALEDIFGEEDPIAWAGYVKSCDPKKEETRIEGVTCRSVAVVLTASAYSKITLSPDKIEKVVRWASHAAFKVYATNDIFVLLHYDSDDSGIRPNAFIGLGVRKAHSELDFMLNHLNNKLRLNDLGSVPLVVSLDVVAERKKFILHESNLAFFACIFMFVASIGGFFAALLPVTPPAQSKALFIVGAVSTLGLYLLKRLLVASYKFAR